MWLGQPKVKVRYWQFLHESIVMIRSVSSERPVEVWPRAPKCVDTVDWCKLYLFIYFLFYSFTKWREEKESVLLYNARGVKDNVLCEAAAQYSPKSK